MYFSFCTILRILWLIVKYVYFVQATLDRESRESYTLSVEARDGAGGQNSLSAYARVTLSVQDENDNQPSITVNALSGK